MQVSAFDFAVWTSRHPVPAWAARFAAVRFSPSNLDSAINYRAGIRFAPEPDNTLTLIRMRLKRGQQLRFILTALGQDRTHPDSLKRRIICLRLLRKLEQA